MTRLFTILDKLLQDSDEMAETVYRLLVFFQIEFHPLQIVRQNLLTNFTDLFKREKAV